MKASIVAYDCGELHKNSELKIIKYGYVKGCPNRLATQIGLLEILGIKPWILAIDIISIIKEIKKIVWVLFPFLRGFQHTRIRIFLILYEISTVALKNIWVDIFKIII
jgi:hypothetical protein